MMTVLLSVREAVDRARGYGLPQRHGDKIIGEAIRGIPS